MPHREHDSLKCVPTAVNNTLVTRSDGVLFRFLTKAHQAARTTSTAHAGLLECRGDNLGGEGGELGVQQNGTTVELYDTNERSPPICRLSKQQARIRGKSAEHKSQQHSDEQRTRTTHASVGVSEYET